MATENNLKTSFAGESQANRKYLAFAEKADAEGYPGVAKLFRAAAEAETIHALSQLKALGLVKSTAENLQAAIEGETHEFTEMYPGFIAEAEKDGNSQAKRLFEHANAAEQVHAGLYSENLASLDQKLDQEYFICPVCGNVNAGSAPAKCVICGLPGERFKQVG